MAIARKCPMCGKHTLYVNSSDHKYDGMKKIGITHKIIRRYLECDECGYKTTTYEIEAQDLRNIRNAYHDTIKKARKIHSVMGRLKTATGHCQDDMEKIYGEQN